MTGRIPILDVEPVISCGRYPARAVPHEQFVVRATVFREGHDAVAAGVVLRGPDGKARPVQRMDPGPPGLDRWETVVNADAEGMWSFTIQAWADPWATWEHAAEIKVPA